MISRQVLKILIFENFQHGPDLRSGDFRDSGPKKCHGHDLYPGYDPLGGRAHFSRPYWVH